MVEMRFFILLQTTTVTTYHAVWLDLPVLCTYYVLTIQAVGHTDRLNRLA